MIVLQALTMSNEARKTTTVGEIVNLMSVDAQKVQDATGYLWMTWSSPLQICIAVYMLWSLMGVSVLAGLAVMILIIPLNAVIAAIARKLQVSNNSSSSVHSYSFFSSHNSNIRWLNVFETRTALSRAHIVAKATDIAKLLPLNKRLVIDVDPCGV